MSEEVFVDGLSEITVTGSTVRMDLVTMSITERKADGEPKLVFKQRIIMPIDSFMNALDLMDNVGRELVQSGAVKRIPEKGTASVNGSSGRAPSPNFE